jgi:hypothetical protein
MHDASSMQKVDSRKEEMEPFAALAFVDLDRDEGGKIGPERRRKKKVVR